MAGPSKKMCASDKVSFYELLQKNEYSDISESEYSSDSEINVKILLGEQSVSSDEAENVNNKTTFSIYWQAWHKCWFRRPQ
jgi:hypothetical protein